MYRLTRQSHRWIGLISSLFLALIAVTGIALALKSKIGALRPPEAEAQKSETPADIASMDRVVASVFALGNKDLDSIEDIDRVDYRPKSNIFKVVSRKAYLEVQVDGKTAEVLSVAPRNDQWIEDIHDLSFFNDEFRTTILPVVGGALALLSLSGIGMFFTPVYRRWHFKKYGPPKKPASNPSSPKRESD